jgi:Resolvase, N terminal domain
MTSRGLPSRSERGVSGSKPLGDRPEGAALLAVLQPGDVVITPKLDRMFRPALDRRQPHHPAGIETTQARGQKEAPDTSRAELGRRELLALKRKRPAVVPALSVSI